MQPQKRSLKGRVLNSIPFLVLILGLLSLNLGLYLDYRKKVLSFRTEPQIFKTFAPEDRLSKPTNIKIEEMGIDVGIEDAEINNSVWDTSNDSANYLLASARPGEKGNIVIYGHNKKGIFANLIKGKADGKIVELTNEDGKLFKYIVVVTDIVKPDAVEIISPTDHEVLTIYTCTGFMDSERLVLKASPI
jgi:LPXTG-site transpeptidase (sortase) family protein